MKANAIMTSPVVTVTPDTSVKEIAETLYRSRISAVPVVDSGRLVGLVSEADLLHRSEIGTDRFSAPESWWLRLFSTDRTPEQYVKSHGRRARDIMTRDVATVGPHTPVAEIATLLETRGIKRVPVVDGERLVGIVSRSNLVQALAILPPPAVRATPSSDEAIRDRLLAELQGQSWWRRQVASNVVVTDGVVHYWGALDSEEEREAARVAAQNVPGVRQIVDHRMRLQDLPASV
jgi:CBS-domain-containing membrane protein